MGKPSEAYQAQAVSVAEVAAGTVVEAAAGTVAGTVAGTMAEAVVEAVAGTVAEAAAEAAAGTVAEVVVEGAVGTDWAAPAAFAAATVPVGMADSLLVELAEIWAIQALVAGLRVA